MGRANGREAHFSFPAILNAKTPGLFWKSENTILVLVGSCLHRSGFGSNSEFSIPAI
jgi:hypothetical protein